MKASPLKGLLFTCATDAACLTQISGPGFLYGMHLHAATNHPDSRFLRMGPVLQARALGRRVLRTLGYQLWVYNIAEGGTFGVAE